MELLHRRKRAFTGVIYKSFSYMVYLCLVQETVFDVYLISDRER